jgi:transcriptional regulator with XRE-family HTH domain
VPTFGELLSTYMTRTGISDSELARTLGISRQTVFRWKEGLVARPRHRDDVLVCARRLRLTPEETDQLLLAAGFAPESPAGLRVGVGTERDERTDTDSGTDNFTDLVVDDIRGRHARRWLFAGIGAAVLMLLGLAWATLGRPTPAPLPVARTGEVLVLVAPRVDAAGHRTSNAVLEAALRREISGLRLAGIRIASWPEPVADATAASVALRRAAATAVLWPAGGGGTGVHFTRAALSGTPAGGTPSADVWPDDATVTEPRLAALLTLADVAQSRGDAAGARGLLVQALPLAAEGSEMQAAVRGALGEAGP